MRSLQQWLDEYGESHQHPLNKTIHWICVPAIFWSVVALLMDLPEIFPGVELAYVIVLLALLFYVRLSLLMGLGMLVWCVFCLASSAWLEVHAPLPLWAIAITVFVVAWIGQFYGHKVEGKKPSFLKDIQFLLIGPAWLMAQIFRRSGVKA